MKKSKAVRKQKPKKRNVYALPDLIKRWEREELTVEQAIGQILLWLDDLGERIQRLENGQQQQKMEAK